MSTLVAPFTPSDWQREQLERAVTTAPRMILAMSQLGREDGRHLSYDDRQWQVAWCGGTAEWMQDTYLDVDARARFFPYAYSSAPAMAIHSTGAGSKYPFSYRDADGAFLKTIPGRNFIVAFRLYGTGHAFYDQTWKLDDLVKEG